MEISFKKKISVIGIGTISTLLILLMFEVLLAQIITDFILDSINDNTILLIIMMSLFIFTMIISIIVGIFITKDITRISVLKATIMSFLCLLLFLFIISNTLLLIFYRNVYSKIHGFEILFIFPSILIYFSIYILQDIFNLFIFEILIYYIFFIVFLEKFYKVKYRE